MSDSLHPSEKVRMFTGCKDDGEDKQHVGGPVSQQERGGSPVVLLEQPFIRCSSCWVIYFSILLAMLLSYGPADLWAKEIGCLSASLRELNLFALEGGGEDSNKPRAFLFSSQTIVN